VRPDGRHIQDLYEGIWVHRLVNRIDTLDRLLVVSQKNTCERKLVPPMRRLWRYCSIIDSANEHIAKLLIWLILPLIAIFCWEVLLRSVFNLPTIWAHESTQYFYGAYFALGGAYALKAGTFIRVDILIERIKPRRRAIVEAITGLVALAFIVALVWKGADIAFYSIKIGEKSETAWGPPIWPIKITVVVGSLLLGIQFLANYIRTLIFAIKGKELS